MNDNIVTLDESATVPSEASSKSDVLTMSELFRLAEALVPTGFLPDHITTPGQAVAIILAGRELGMPPMRSLRSLSMVKGKVTENADSQLARFKSAGGRALFERLDDEAAVLRLCHPNGDEHVETFTVADARRAGLLHNQNYQRYPRAMLRSRAITAGLKSVGWEGGTGTYDPEELAGDSLDMRSAPSAAHRPPAAAPPPSPGTTPEPISAEALAAYERRAVEEAQRVLAGTAPEPPADTAPADIDDAREPEAESEPEPVLAPTCWRGHGEMVWREGISKKTQQPFAFWGCPDRECRITMNRVSDAQIKRLYAIAKEHAVTNAELRTYATHVLGVRGSNELTTNRDGMGSYEKLCAAIESGAVKGAV